MNGIFLALFLIVSSTAAFPEFQKEFKCDGGQWTAAQRKSIVDQHNGLRARLIHGLAKNANDEPMPRGKNMHKLRWSCDLEKSAQKWAHETQCKLKHSTAGDREGVGENLFGFWISSNFATETATPADIGLRAGASWWSELPQLYNYSSVVFTKELFEQGVGHFTQMAWGSTLEIGCGVERCTKSKLGTPASNTTSFVVVCHYKPVGNVLGMEIYEVGEPCEENYDCTYSNQCSKNDGLCEIPEND